MIADLHAHYPMHLPFNQGRDALSLMTATSRKGWWGKIGAELVKIAANLADYPKPGAPAVNIPNLKAGDVRIALSVLYVPFDEIDLTEPYAAPPEETYFTDLAGQIQAVETDIAQNFAADAAVAHNHVELDRALADGKVALIHAVEGGFQLGGTPDHVKANVHQLAQLGVAYVTVAHLFWRRVATNAPALPFLPDWIYSLWFHQPGGGLSDLGQAVIEAMVDQRILIDVTHMSEDSLDATFALLDKIDSGRTVPVIATHSAYRFGKLKYNLTASYIQKIAGRGGVVGLIACDHFMTDGIASRTTTFEQSMDVVSKQIDKLAELTGGYDHIAFGSDLDGFIRPTLAGLEVPMGFAKVHDFLSQKFSAEIADKICSGNAQRVLGYWRGRT